MYLEITHDLRDFFHRNLLLWDYKNADLFTYTVAEADNCMAGADLRACPVDRINPRAN